MAYILMGYIVMAYVVMEYLRRGRLGRLERQQVVRGVERRPQQPAPELDLWKST